MRVSGILIENVNVQTKSSGLLDYFKTLKPQRFTVLFCEERTGQSEDSETKEILLLTRNNIAGDLIKLLNRVDSLDKKKVHASALSISDLNSLVSKFTEKK